MIRRERMLHMICNLASHAARNGHAERVAGWGSDEFARWVVDLGVREGQWLRREQAA